MHFIILFTGLETAFLTPDLMTSIHAIMTRLLLLTEPKIFKIYFVLEQSKSLLGILLVPIAIFCIFQTLYYHLVLVR